MDATLNSINQALQGFGVSLVDRTRLTFGAPTMKALAGLPDTGKVFVACKGGAALLQLPSKLNEEARKTISIIDATDTDYAKVRPHVANFAKGRKVKVAVAAIRNADDEPIGFTVSRKK